MASINDFKILHNKCLKYFTYLTDVYKLKRPADTESEKARLGFYIYMLENICETKEISELVDMITDSEFNSFLYGTSSDDFGIDAVYIDDKEKNIYLFNFKYREKFNQQKKQSINETILSTKYINAIINEDTSALIGKPKATADNIIRRLNSSEIYKFRLYVISNDNIELESTDENLGQLRRLYDLEFEPVGLPYISQMMSIRPTPLNATLILDQDAVMSFSEHVLSSSISYITRMRASDLVRITCDNEKLRGEYNIEDLGKLSDAELDFGALFDNVRGFVLKSKYNSNILQSLKNNPSKFFMYNNGITIAAKNIKTQDVNANKKVKITIEDFQILNGGQTLRTIHLLNKESENAIIEYLSKSEILVRVFCVDEDTEAVSKIAEYTNSQNAISNIDLKSLSSEQIDIERYLDGFDIVYARKSGDTGINKNKDYKHKISMEKFGQILFSIKGSPEKATNNKQDIFDKHYKDIFSP